MVVTLRLFASLLIIGVCGIVFGFDQGQPKDNTIQSSRLLSSVEMASKQAEKILGVSLEGHEIQASLESSVKDNITPFLSEEITDKPLWRVHVPALSISLSADGKSFTPERTFTLLISPTDGHLVRLWTDWPAGAGSEPAWASADEAAAQLRNTGPEIWTGFPDSSPRSTFRDVLEVIERSFGGVVESKQFNAYVIRGHEGARTDGHNEDVLLWSVDLRGLPPEALPARLQERAKTQPSLSHLRHLVRDDDCRRIMTSNTPNARPDGMVKTKQAEKNSAEAKKVEAQPDVQTPSQTSSPQPK